MQAIVRPNVYAAARHRVRQAHGSLQALRELSTPWPLLLARPELAWSIKAFERRSKTPALESSIREEISFSKC